MGHGAFKGGDERVDSACFHNEVLFVEALRRRPTTLSLAPEESLLLRSKICDLLLAVAGVYRLAYCDRQLRLWGS